MQTAATHPGRAVKGRRLEAAVLFATICVGCHLLWLAVPVATLWGISHVVDSGAAYLLLSLMLVPCALIGFVWLLGRANRRYLAITTAPAPKEEERRLRGPLESMLPASIILAVIVLLLWMLFFSQHFWGQLAGPLG